LWPFCGTGTPQRRKKKKNEIEKDLAYEHRSAGGGRCEKNL